MAKRILVANWKNHPASLSEAQSLLKALSKNKLLYKKLSLFIAPPVPYLESVALRAGSFAQVGLQDISSLPKGTYTGETSVEMVKSFGARLSIIGHSERRALGETDEAVSLKIKVALRAGIAPLVCVGESTRDTDGEHFELLRSQIKSSLVGLSRQAALKVAIAYEPSWAIGKSAKDALGAPELAESVIFIKKVLTELFGRATAENIPILYGGSVEPLNAEALAQGTGIRGFLVGHASRKPEHFASIATSLLQK